MDSYINATLWTIVFNDPVGDVPGLEVCMHCDMIAYLTVFTDYFHYSIFNRRIDRGYAQ